MTNDKFPRHEIAISIFVESQCAGSAAPAVSPYQVLTLDPVQDPDHPCGPDSLT